MLPSQREPYSTAPYRGHCLPTHLELLPRRRPRSMARFEKQHPSRLTTAPDAPSVSCVPGPKDLLLSRHRAHVDLWHLPACPTPDATTPEGSLLDVDAAPELLCRVRLKTSGRLLAAACSADGRYVAASDDRSTRVFLASDTGEAARVREGLPAASALVFLGPQHFALAGVSGGLWVYDLGADADAPPTKLLSGPKEGAKREDPISVLETDGALLVACARRQAWLFDWPANKQRHPVPVPNGPVTCASVSSAHGLVLLATAENDVTLYDVASRKVTGALGCR